MKGVIAILVMLVVANCVDAESLYGCWGGCYNKCFLGNAKSQSQNKLACEKVCLNSCIPPTPAGFEYYCKIGCSLKRCNPLSNDGAKLEECFGWCTHLCSGSLSP